MFEYNLLSLHKNLKEHEDIYKRTCKSKGYILDGYIQGTGLEELSFIPAYN